MLRIDRKRIAAVLLLVILLVTESTAALAARTAPAGKCTYYDLDHHWGSWKTVKEPSCTKPGWREHACKCGAVEGEKIPAAGHDFRDGETVTEATCVQEGRMTVVCSRCGLTSSRTVTKKEHVYDKGTVVRRPGRLRPGTLQFVCTVCGEMRSEDIYPEHALRRGGKNDRARVIRVQEELSRQGYNVGEADGIFGLRTENGVRAYQKDNGLRVDGIVWGDIGERLVQDSLRRGNGSAGSEKQEAPVVHGPFRVTLVTPSTGRTVLRMTDEKGDLANWPDYDGDLFFQGWKREDGILYMPVEGRSYTFTKDTVLTADEAEWNIWNTVDCIDVENFVLPDLSRDISEYAAAVQKFGSDKDLVTYTVSDRILQMYEPGLKKWLNVYSGEWEPCTVYRVLVTAKTKYLAEGRYGHYRFAEDLGAQFGYYPGQAERKGNYDANAEIRFTTDGLLPTEAYSAVQYFRLCLSEYFLFADGKECPANGQGTHDWWVRAEDGKDYRVLRILVYEDGIPKTGDFTFDGSKSYRIAVSLQTPGGFENDAVPVVAELDDRYHSTGRVTSAEAGTAVFEFDLGNPPELSKEEIIRTVLDMDESVNPLEDRAVETAARERLFEQGFNAEEIDAIIGTLRNAPYPYVSLWIVNMWEYVVVSHDYDGTAHYTPIKSNIYLNKASSPYGMLSTFFHESGHAIDDHREPDDSIFYPDYCTESYHWDTQEDYAAGTMCLKDALLADARVLATGSLSAGSDLSDPSLYRLIMISAKYPSSGFSNHVDPEEFTGSDLTAYHAALDALQNTLNSASYRSFVRDVGSGISNLTVYPNGGHTSPGYWYKGNDYTSPMTGAQCREAWAEFFSAKLMDNTEALRDNEKYFPRASEVLERIAYEMLDSMR